MGQSNMHGLARAAELKSPYREKHDRIRIWANGQWEYFVPRNRLGPGVSMAHELADLWPKDTIGIIKISDGGTGVRAFERKWSSGLGRQLEMCQQAAIVTISPLRPAS